MTTQTEDSSPNYCHCYDATFHSLAEDCAQVSQTETPGQHIAGQSRYRYTQTNKIGGARGYQEASWSNRWSDDTLVRPALARPIQRIALLSVHTCPLALMGGKKTGGMNVYVRELARTLGAQGIIVDVFTRSQDACQPTIKHDLGHGGRVIHIQAGPESPIPAAEVSLYIDEFVEGVCDFAEAEAATYDLIHSHYWISGLVAQQLQKRWASPDINGMANSRVPIVHMFHTLGEMKNQIALTSADCAPQYRIDGEKEVVEAADLIVAATPSEEEQLLQYYGADPQKIRVLPPGVDLEHFQPIPQSSARQRLGIPVEKQNILFAGRIEALKGIDTLLEAAWLLKNRHGESLPGLTVTIIGGDPHADTLEEEMARLQEIRRTLELSELVTFAGAKDQALLPQYYAAADVVVMPSHYESFGMVALEAMAMGKAVIASEVGGLAHLVAHGETGFHIPPRDAEALSARLFELLMDNTFRQRLGTQAQNYAQQFGWGKIATYMQRIYAQAQPVPA